MSEININVEHLTRVEGHGNIVLNAKDGTVENVQWQVSEAPRLFEAFVRDKPYHQLAQITSRICGICSIGHTLASLKATEAAMGIEISEQSQILRRLAIHGENMQSHILHVGYLVAPDMFGVGSVIPMVETHTDAVLAIVNLHRLSNEYSDLICGRTTHPTNLVPGGIFKTPSPIKLKQMRQRLVDAVPTANAVAEVVLANAHALPDFTRETEFIALTSDDEYALYDGEVGSTDTGRHSVDDYLSLTNEFVVPQSTAKYTKHNRDSYMVGALARLNLNYNQLHPLAKSWSDKFGLKPVNHNPFMNNVAQLVEFVHSIEDSIALIDKLFETGLKKEPTPKITPKAGRGIGAVDVPRGILFHDYTYDEKGICQKANCIIPTNQNHNNIQKDFEVFAPTLLDKSEKEIELNLEMLVRAYDPCISCSTHYLNVEWKK
ncbi:MAG: Ni/Fe hydrogenase subunit alpha [Candidatus Thermoplasmatota archaeon]|nr:Ni/Fe hydrogenase subunit alpha [Euryarchaeota archaeon]MBU4031973.1 Ni/Fe hydrogenase subunit alpha [Candidatus Thermoplasmatota archaeon]MBU4143724.1 Ni/Fe hydrogenase subunit alpha [Candidatus Thermoplasmatota archaeon]MBU4592407.1 Ni/Fe hydrogenase subunit alpha [Candidatus Thermoplasmatota archaeon]